MLICLFILGLLADDSGVPPTQVNHPGLKQLGWQQAISADAFKPDSSVFEMIETLHKMDVHHIELSAGLPFAADNKDVIVSPAINHEQADAILAKLKSVRMDIVSYDAGPKVLSDEDLKQVCDLAKRLKAKNIVLAAKIGDLDRLEKAAADNSINFAIKPGDDANWLDPDQAVKALSGKSNRIGICLSPAECVKHHVDPLEYTRKLKAHIIEVELLDAAPEGDSVRLTQGAGKVSEVLSELKQQQFKGVFTVKPDTTGKESLAHLVESINAFSKIVTSLVASESNK
jgi:sugar phosphate isomerase/epimerase